MNSKLEKNRNYGFLNDEEDVLRGLFIEYLIQIYCTSSHLAERLPELAEQIEFKDLHGPINHTIEEVNRQLLRINGLLKLVDSDADLEACGNIILLMENAFSLIHNRLDNSFRRDLAILYYLQNVLSVQEGSLQMLDLIASRMKNLHIKLLVIENHQNAIKITNIQEVIHARYINQI